MDRLFESVQHRKTSLRHVRLALLCGCVGVHIEPCPFRDKNRKRSPLTKF